jgi:hypothetical protein
MTASWDSVDAAFEDQDYLPWRERAERAVRSLERWHGRLVRDWADGAPGWAPEVASAVLSRSRLDRQASLCACLSMFLDEPSTERADGFLILAWTNLGSLVEGTLKFFLSVYAFDYAANPTVARGGPLEPDALGFEQLRQYFVRNVWIESNSTWDAWLLELQSRRNAIHAYRDRELGNHGEFLAALIGYAELAAVLDSSVPDAPDQWSG